MTNLDEGFAALAFRQLNKMSTQTALSFIKFWIFIILDSSSVVRGWKALCFGFGCLFKTLLLKLNLAVNTPVNSTTSTRTVQLRTLYELPVTSLKYVAKLKVNWFRKIHYLPPATMVNHMQ